MEIVVFTLHSQRGFADVVEVTDLEVNRLPLNIGWAQHGSAFQGGEHFLLKLERCDSV